MTWLRRIDKGQLHPGLVAVIDRAMDLLEKNDTPFKAYSGLRTFEEQDVLYAQGRTKGEKGKFVTKGRGGQSMHNYGLAVDLAPYNMLTDNPDDLWWPKTSETHGWIWLDLEKALTEAAQAIDDEADDGIDYESGLRWKFRDAPHCQVRTTLRELKAGHYPYCRDVDWLVSAHETFLLGTPWMTRRVQYLLNAQSYDCGPVDGDHGVRTKKAIAAFRQDQGIASSEMFVGSLVRLDHAAISVPHGTTPEELPEFGALVPA